MSTLDCPKGMTLFDWWEKERKKLSIEKQQEFVDLMCSGKKIGEAREISGISFEAANGIMRSNIKSRLFFNSEVENDRSNKQGE